MMPVTAEQIEAEAMKLPDQARSELLGRLMRSLADASAMDQEVAEAWAQEAVRRDEEMESGSVAGLLEIEVFEELRSKGK
jgi:hypothetical protein